MRIFDDEKKKIVNFKLLFRASEHNFEAKAFHEYCDGKPQTILLVKTNYGKIIGGYTPIEWQSINEKKCVN